jgi:hypothetical protein
MDQVSRIIILIILGVSIIVTGGIAICKNEYCDWEENICVVYDASITSDRLYAVYTYEKSQELLYILSSNNQTYLEDLIINTYYDNSYHPCYIKSTFYVDDHDIILIPYTQEEINNLIYGVIACMISFIIIYFDTFGCFYNKIIILRIDQERLINQEDPPPY